MLIVHICMYNCLYLSVHMYSYVCLYNGIMYNVDLLHAYIYVDVYTSPTAEEQCFLY